MTDQEKKPGKGGFKKRPESKKMVGEGEGKREQAANENGRRKGKKIMCLVTDSKIVGLFLGGKKSRPDRRV